MSIKFIMMHKIMMLLMINYAHYNTAEGLRMFITSFSSFIFIYLIIQSTLFVLNHS